jgi:hypothetical protein
MTVNAKIRAVDYNTIRNQVNLVLGTGLGNTGYGQTSLVTSSTVSESNKVSATDWNKLKADITTCWNHIYNANPTTALAVENATIRSNSTDSPYSQYQTLATSITTDRFTTPPNNIITAKGSSSQTWPGNFGSRWNNTVQCLVTVSWSTADQARYFFNSGGEIRFSSSRSGGTTSGGSGTIASQNNEWTTYLSSTVGTRGFGGNIPTAGTGGLTGGNFYRLSNVYTNPWYSSTAGGNYSLSSFKIWARAIDIANNSSGGATTIEFLVEWNDNHTGASGGPDGVDGTLSLAVSEIRAAGALTIESATVNVGRIEPAGIPSNSTFITTNNFASLNEGSSVTFTVNTFNVSNGTQLYWSLASGPGFTASDFADGAGTGSFTINNNTGSFVRTLAADYVTEGAEFFLIEIRINSVGGQIVSTSDVISVNDTTIMQFASITSNYVSTQTVRALAVAQGWNQSSRLQFTIEQGYYFSGTENLSYNGSDSPIKHRDVAGLVVEGSFPNGLIIINKGHISGRGGRGAAGAGGNGATGFVGTPGLVLTSTYSGSFLQLWNYGAITGGGGGGGSGGGASGVGDGGGGGGGAPFGVGGTGGIFNNAPGATASFYGSGDGGNEDGGFSKGGRGGSQGAAGESGSGNRPNRSATSGGAGGAGGYSIIGISSMSVVVGGTRNGPDLSGPSSN